MSVDLARLPRPELAVRPDPRLGRRVRIALVHRIAAAHAAATRGALLMPVLSVLDRLLPSSPLPEVRATLAPGVRVDLDPVGALARSALIAGGYEHREGEVLAAAVRPGGVFLDVGANVGWFSLLVAAHRPQSAVWALEPVPGTADLLEHNLDDAGLAGSVRVLRCAAGSTQGTAHFVTTADNAFAHQVSGAAGGGVQCPVTTLDEVWRDAHEPRVDAVKVDVEGAEVEALRGARALLARDRPLVLAEAPRAEHRRALERELARHGYRRRTLAGLLPYNSVFTADR